MRLPELFDLVKFEVGFVVSLLVSSPVVGFRVFDNFGPILVDQFGGSVWPIIVEFFSLHSTLGCVGMLLIFGFKTFWNIDSSYTYILYIWGGLSKSWQIQHPGRKNWDHPMIRLDL